MKDPIDGVVVQRMLEVLVLHIMVKVVIQSRVIDSVYVDMSMGLGGFTEEGIVPFSVDGVDRVKTP